MLTDISPTIANYICGMSEKLRKQVGQAIKTARVNNGLTQGDLAKATGIQQPNLSAMENGKENVSLDQLERIADALGVNVKVLFE